MDNDRFFKNNGCTEAIIRKVEAELGKPFPASYIGFLIQSNGGEGKDDENRYMAMSVTRAEMEYKLEQGMSALDKKFSEHDPAAGDLYV